MNINELVTCDLKTQEKMPLFNIRAQYSKGGGQEQWNEYVHCSISELSGDYIYIEYSTLNDANISFAEGMYQISLTTGEVKPFLGRAKDPEASLLGLCIDSFREDGKLYTVFWGNDGVHIMRIYDEESSNLVMEIPYYIGQTEEYFYVLDEYTEILLKYDIKKVRK